MVVPGRLRGRACLTSVQIEGGGEGALGDLAGAHPGIHVAGMRFLLRPARHPIGITSTFRAPLRAPEPALFLSRRRAEDLLDVR